MAGSRNGFPSNAVWKPRPLTEDDRKGKGSERRQPRKTPKVPKAPKVTDCATITYPLTRGVVTFVTFAANVPNVRSDDGVIASLRR